MKINKKKKGVFHADEGVDVGEPTPLPAGCRGEVPRSPLALHVTYHLTHSLSLPPSLPFSPKPHRFPHRSLLSFVISSFASHTLSLSLYIYCREVSPSSFRSSPSLAISLRKFCCCCENPGDVTQG